MSDPRTVALVTKNYRFWILPDSKQEALAIQTLGCCRVVGNDSLALHKKHYEETGHFLPLQKLYEACVKDAKKRTEREWLAAVDSKALNCTIQLGIGRTRIMDKGS